jgi:predicted peptidase
VPSKKRASVDAEQEQTLELSEKDVINMLETVFNGYLVDRSAMFLTGQSRGSGRTWYLGTNYA